MRKVAALLAQSFCSRTIPCSCTSTELDLPLKAWLVHEAGKNPTAAFCQNMDTFSKAVHLCCFFFKFFMGCQNLVLMVLSEFLPQNQLRHTRVRLFPLTLHSFTHSWNPTAFLPLSSLVFVQYPQVCISHRFSSPNFSPSPLILKLPSPCRPECLEASCSQSKTSAYDFHIFFPQITSY